MPFCTPTRSGRSIVGALEPGVAGAPEASAEVALRVLAVVERRQARVLDDRDGVTPRDAAEERGDVAVRGRVFGAAADRRHGILRADLRGVGLRGERLAVLREAHVIAVADGERSGVGLGDLRLGGGRRWSSRRGRRCNRGERRRRVNACRPDCSLGASCATRGQGTEWPEFKGFAEAEREPECAARPNRAIGASGMARRATLRPLPSLPRFRR